MPVWGLTETPAPIGGNWFRKPCGFVPSRIGVLIGFVDWRTKPGNLTKLVNASQPLERRQAQQDCPVGYACFVRVCSHDVQGSDFRRATARELDSLQRTHANAYYAAFAPWTKRNRDAFGRFPQNRVVEFPSANHYFFMAKPEEAARVIDAFLDRVGPVESGRSRGD